MKNSDEAGRCLKSMGNALKLLGNFSATTQRHKKNGVQTQARYKICFSTWWFFRVCLSSFDFMIPNHFQKLKVP